MRKSLWMAMVGWIVLVGNAWADDWTVDIDGDEAPSTGSELHVGGHSLFEGTITCNGPIDTTYVDLDPWSGSLPACTTPDRSLVYYDGDSDKAYLCENGNSGGAEITTQAKWNTSAEIAANVTDETGSGALVLGTSPTIATPVLDLPTTDPTTNSGRIAYDATNDRLTVGESSGTRYFYHQAPTLICSHAGFPTFTTTVTYMGGLTTVAGSLSTFTTESTRQDASPLNLSCTELRAVSDSTLAASEAVTITLRKDTNQDGTGADTALACTIDGDAASSIPDGTSTKKGCRDTESTPVTIATNDLVSYSLVCAGAGCPTGNVAISMCLKCWGTN